MTTQDERPQRPELKIGDADRYAVVQQLERAAGEGRLTFAELEERIEAAMAARVGSDLAPLTADLPAVASPDGGVPGSPVPETPGTVPPTRVSRRWRISLAGDIKHGGWIEVDDELRSFCLFGDTVIDLSSANLPGGPVEILAVSVFGDVKLIVPDGARVECRSQQLIGSTEQDLAAATPLGPFVSIRSFGLFGDLKVYSRSRVPDGKLRSWWRSVRGIEAPAPSTPPGVLDPPQARTPIAAERPIDGGRTD